MAEKIKGITVEIGGKTDELDKALRNVDKQIRATQASLKEVDKLLKLDPGNTNLLKEKQKLLTDQIGKTVDKLQGLKKAQEEAKQMLARGDIGQEAYDALGKKIERCETDLGKLQQAQEETEKKLKPSAEKIGQAFQDVGTKIEEVGKKLAPLSGAAAAGLGIAVKSAKDWETAFTGVKKTVDTTEEGYERLGQGIQEMATRTASSAEDIAGVAEAAGQLGVGADDILTFTETMVQLGDTTNLSSTEAATALARFMNVTGGSQKDVGKLGSAVVELGNNFATDERSIVEMSQRLAAAGKIAGLSETDILGLAASMSSVGIQAEAGGTAMTQTLTEIDKIVSGTAKDSSKKMQTLAKISGMSANDFADAWKKNPIKAIEAFIGGLGDLDGEGESATAMLDELGMSGVRQGNMLKSLSLASGVLTKAVQTSNAAYKDNTALTNEANKRYSTFDAQLSQTKESAKAVAVEFGQVMLPVLKDLLEDIKDILSWAKGLDDETKKTIVTVAGVVAALAPVLMIGGKIVSGVGSLIKGIGGLNGAMNGMLGPVSLVAAGIGTVVAISSNYQKGLEEIRKAHAELTPEQQALAEKINEQAAAWEAIETARNNAYKDIETQTKQEWELWEALDKIVDDQGKVVEGKEEEARILIDQLNGALGTELELVNGEVTGYKNLSGHIADVIQKKEAEALLAADQEAWAEAYKNHEQAALDVAKASSDVVDQEKLVEAQEKKVQEITAQLAREEADWNDETLSFSGRRQELTDKLNEETKALEGDRKHLEELKNTQESARTQLDKYNATLTNHDKLQTAIASGSTEMMRQAQKDLVNGFIDAEHGSKESLERQAKNAVQKYGEMRDIVKNTGDQMAKDASYSAHEAATKAINEVAKVNPQLAAELKKQLNTINQQSQQWNAKGQANAKSYESGVKTGLSNVPSTIKSKLNLSSSAYDWGRDLAKSYASGITKATPQVNSAASGVAKQVRALLHFSEPDEGPLSDFHTYGPDMMKLFAQGIDQSSWQVVQAVQGVAGNIRSALQGTTVTAQLDQKSIPLSPGVTLNIANFNNYSDSDIRELTNEIMETAASFAARKGAVFA